MTGGITGFIDFSADTILETTRIQSLPSFNNSVISSTNGITGTITSPGNAFTGIKTDSVLQYQTAGTSDINFNRVTAISSDLKTLTVAGITTVSGNDVDFYSVKGVTAVDFRADNYSSFASLEKNSIDLYSSLKSVYLQSRENKINNSTQSDDEWGNLDN